MDDTAVLLQDLLLYVLMPLWLLAGFADYCCHRVWHIEDSAGIKESRLHLLLLAELGIGLLGALLFEIDAAVLALLIAACLSHEITVWWDLSYAASRRRIPVPEQWVHGLQQAIPWVALAAVMLLHPDQALALFGLGDSDPDWVFRLKAEPLPLPYLALFAAAAVLLVLLPFLGEYRRCRRQRGQRSLRPI